MPPASKRKHFKLSRGEHWDAVDAWPGDTWENDFGNVYVMTGLGIWERV